MIQKMKEQDNKVNKQNTSQSDCEKFKPADNCLDSDCDVNDEYIDSPELTIDRD